MKMKSLKNKIIAILICAMVFSESTVAGHFFYDNGVKKYMDDNGIKQKYISDNSNIPENTLSMILNGKRKLYADELVEILKALNVDADAILFLKETETDG